MFPLVLGLVLGGVIVVGNLFGDTAGGWAIAVTGVGGVAFAVHVVARRRRHRRDSTAQWADEHGWHYDRTSAVVPRSGRNVLRTVLDGIAVTSYTTTTASDMTSEHAAATRHALAATLPASFPRLVILPEALTRRPGAAPLAPDIQFESAAFNAQWRVHCSDATFAHAFCHPRVMERLMRVDAAGLSIFVEGRDVVVHAPGPAALDAIDGRAALVADLIRLVPPYLIAGYPAPTRRARGAAADGSWIWALLLLWPVALVLWLLAAATGADELSAAVGLAIAGAVYATAIVAVERSERRQKRARSQARAGAERSPFLPPDS
jgi:hypothetical protein